MSAEEFLLSESEDAQQKKPIPLLYFCKKKKGRRGSRYVTVNSVPFTEYNKIHQNQTIKFVVFRYCGEEQCVTDV